MANVPIYNLTDTWNAGGTTFNAIKMSVTDTASASGSLLLDLLVGGSSKFSVSKAGNTTLSGTLGVGGSDCILLREAANALAMRNGVNAQTLRLYNTYTDASNYERGYLDWSSNVMRLGTEKLGSGTARALQLQTDGVTRMTIGTTGLVGIGGDPVAGSRVHIQGATNVFGLRFSNANATTPANGFRMGVGWPGFFDDIFFIETPGGQRPISITATGGTTFANSATFSGTVTVNSATTFLDAVNVVFSTGTNGNKLGTATTQKIAFWNKTPIVQPTTSHAEAAFVENSGGTAVNVDSTFGGYTLQQVVKALQDVGLLA